MSGLADDARREIRELHDFFGAWYRDETDAFDHPAASLAPSFRMVAPDGSERDRGTVLEAIREGRGSETGRDPPFVIEIRNLRTLRTMGDYCQLTYEEWQRRETWDARRSTALFERGDGPNDVVWIDLHETRFDPD
ncbi:MAG: hypothetical protein ABEI75_00820 [Halobaculum sp.]